MFSLTKAIPGTREEFSISLRIRALPCVAWLVALLGAGSAWAGLQLPNLNSTPTVDRFLVTGRVWPAQPGQAVVCLWEDDKLCTVTMSVDDNIAPQVPTWFQLSAEVGFPVTWFVITDRIGGSNSGFNGTWQLWRDVVAKGHDVQSHTRQHLHVDLPEWPGIYEEYAGSRAAIELNIPGHKCDFLAYPGGTNSTYNSRSDAAIVYAGARGGTGSGFNRPGRIDYLAIRNGVFVIGGTTKSVDMLAMFDATDLRYYRAWAAPLFHNVQSWADADPYLTFIRTYRSDVWAARFSDVGKYGQQRDTAKLTVTTNESERIVFDLTDDMMDSVFNYPLTIKVRIPSHWGSVLAIQGGVPVRARIVRNAGAPFVLARAVPDRGEVTLTQATSPTLGGETYQEWLREHILPLDRTGLGSIAASPAGDGIPNLMKYALRLDPRTAGNGDRISHGMEADSRLSLTFRRPYPVPADVEYLPEAGSDLSGWSAEGLVIEEGAILDGMQTLRVTDRVRVDEQNPKRFIRLRVREKAPSH